MKQHGGLFGGETRSAQGVYSEEYGNQNISIQMFILNNQI